MLIFIGLGVYFVDKNQQYQMDKINKIKLQIESVERRLKVINEEQVSQQKELLNTITLLNNRLSNLDESINKLDKKVNAVQSRVDDLNYINKQQYNNERIASRSNNAASFLVFNCSAYTASADECGNAQGITASGNIVQANHTIAMGNTYPFGTQVQIEGFPNTIFVCEDRGGSIQSNCIDIYMQTKSQAYAFGRRQLKVKIIS
jgi:3D (Asp-Asp-Asp) domain-containing protein